MASAASDDSLGPPVGESLVGRSGLGEYPSRTVSVGSQFH